MKKSLFFIPIVATILSSSLYAFPFYTPDISTQIEDNKRLIKQYEATIKKLKADNKHMLEEKKKHPELYVKKPLFEETKKAYIYRIKLNGSKAESLKFEIKDSRVNVSMDMKQEQKSDDGYYYSSQYFSTQYKIPDDVIQDKITHFTDGDYFTIKMPK